MHNPTEKCLQGAQVTWNRPQKSGYYRMGLRCGGHVARADPGQFLMVRLKGQQSPLLSRPFSIHQVITEKGRIRGFEILYKVVGDGTALLAGARRGDGIDILGPLGKSCVIPPGHKAIFFVAGGIGVAPFLFLAARMSAGGFDMSRVLVFLGGRTENDLLCVEDFEALGISPRLTTDDGSRGRQGLVTVPLEEAIGTSRPDMLYACGPLPMLRQVMTIAAHHDLPCQVSIETMMACGMGACLGCAVKDKKKQDAYRHACVDGPVFDADEILL
jgi:dihydroorotate dehydrogenase electron transfer subunit